MSRFDRIAEWTSKWAKWAKWIGYPLFYFFCLAIFGYLTFPFDQLKGRIIAEFDRMQDTQRRRPGEQPMRLEIEELDGYWLSGVEVTGARLIIPPPPAPKASPRGGFGFAGGGDKGSEPAKAASELLIDHATARVQLLPLLAGDVVVKFDAEAFGGTLEGSLPVGGEAGDVEVGFDALQLANIAPLGDLLQGVPLSGLASGEVHLSPKEGKFSKADGQISVQIEAVKLGSKQKNEDTGELEDVVEIQGIRIPSVQVGTVVIEGVAVNGLLTLDQFAARGRDFELLGEGKIKLGETWETSQADISLKFKFSDAYRTASAAATSLLGKPGDKVPPLIEAGPSPLRRAKTEDGYYRFELQGPLGKAEPRPAGTAGSSRRPTTRGRGRATPPPRAAPRLNQGRPSPRPPVRRRPAPRDEPEEREPPRIEREPPQVEREPEPEPDVEEDVPPDEAAADAEEGDEEEEADEDQREPEADEGE